jgi:Flp pilus assembly protein TadG
MVEMALVLPFLLFIVLGTIEVGYYIYMYSELENATRRASERASKTPPRYVTNPNDPNDKCTHLAEYDAIQGVFLSDLGPKNITFYYPPVVEADGTSRQAIRQVGDQIEVALNYSGPMLTPIGERIFGDVLQFQFRSRRTITSIQPPRGFNADCSPQ